MNKYEIEISGLYENIYTIIDMYTKENWTFVDLDFEQENDEPLLHSVQSICNLLNEKENKIEELKFLLQVIL